MTLTLNACVVTKWFVKEQEFEEARGLLGHRIHLHAPDILDVSPSWRHSPEHASKMVLSVGHGYAAGYGYHWRTRYPAPDERLGRGPMQPGCFLQIARDTGEQLGRQISMSFRIHGADRA